MSVTKNILVFVLFLNIPLVSFAQPENTINFGEAVELYNQTQYNEAATAFRSIAEKGKSQEWENNKEIEFSKIYILLCQQIEKQNFEVNLLEELKDKYKKTAPGEELLFEIGNIYFREELFEKSRQYYNELDTTKLSEKRIIERHFRLGVIEFKNKNYDTSSSHFKKIISIPSNFKEASLYYESYNRYLKDDIEQAIWIFSQSNSHSFAGPFFAYLRALKYYFEGNYLKSWEMAKQNIDNDRRNNNFYTPHYYRIVAMSRFRMDAYSEAVTYFNKLSSFADPMTENDLYNWALGLYLSKRYNKALKVFSKINNENKFYQHSLYMIGNIYIKTEKHKESFPYFFKAFQMDFDKKIVQVSLYQCILLWHKKKDYPNLKFYIEKYLKNYPKSKKNPYLKTLLLDAYIKTKKLEDGLILANNIQDTDDNKKLKQILYFKLGTNYGNRKAYSKAVTFLNKSLRYTQDKTIESKAHFYNGECYFQLKKYSHAYNSYKKVLRLSNDARIINDARIGLLYSSFEMGRYNQVVGHFNTINKKLIPQKEKNNINLKLADSYLVLKNYSDAIKYYDKFLENSTQNKEYVLFQKAIIYGINNKIEEKINLFKTLLSEKYDSSIHDKVYYQLGLTYFKVSDFDNALKYFNTILHKYPKSKIIPRALLHKGYIYFNKKDDKNSIKILKNILTSFPQYRKVNTEAKELLKTIYIFIGQPRGYFSFISKLDGKNKLSNEEKINAIYDSLILTYDAENYTLTINNAEILLSEYVIEKEKMINVRRLRGESFEKLNSPERAFPDYQWLADSIDLPQTQLKYRGKLTNFYITKKQPRKAIEIYLENIKINPQDSLQIFKKVFKIALENSIDDFVKNYGEKLTADTLLNIKEKTEIMFDMVQYDQGSTSWINSVKNMLWISKEMSGKDAARAVYELANLYFKKEKYDKAEAKITRLVERFKEYDYYVAKALILQSRIYIKTEFGDKAYEILQSIKRNYKNQDDGILTSVEEALKEIDEKN